MHLNKSLQGLAFTRALLEKVKDDVAVDRAVEKAAEEARDDHGRWTSGGESGGNIAQRVADGMGPAASRRYLQLAAYKDANPHLSTADAIAHMKSGKMDAWLKANGK